MRLSRALLRECIALAVDQSSVPTPFWAPALTYANLHTQTCNFFFFLKKKLLLWGLRAAFITC